MNNETTPPSPSPPPESSDPENPSIQTMPSHHPPPTIKITLPPDAQLANLQHLPTTSPVTITSLCRDLSPGETLAIHLPNTEGKQNKDFVALFHLFGTLTSVGGEVFIVEVEVDVEGLVREKGRRVGSKDKVGVKELCRDTEKGEVVGVYRDGLCLGVDK
ncbi:hypothetical protein D6C92_10630 [Aureobasidium pullulans]|nr:hypothetical protein D6C92_10630 [Aureobasidium pullulans]